MDRPILFHSLTEARAALAAGAALGRPVTLISAPAAGAHGGAGWFLGLVAAAQAAHPDVAVTAILDCADLPGCVQAGLRAGVTDLLFTGDAETTARLTAIATTVGARVHSATRLPGPALDLRGTTDAEAACRRWLGADSRDRSYP